MQFRILRHLLFWLVYFGIILFNDVFLSYSYIKSPSPEHIVKSALTLCILLLIKIPVVYYTLFSFIPRWQKDDGRMRMILELTGVIVAAIVFYRVLIHLVIWKYIWTDPPMNNIPPLEYIARIFYSLLDIMQVVGLAAAIKLLRLRIAAVKKEKSLLQEKLHAELQQLKSQVNPHFLFNSLNSIYALARVQSAETPGVVMKLSGILRYMLYGNKNVLAKTGDEINLVNDYLELQKVRFGDKRVINLTSTISNDEVLIPPLIMLPLLENIFKHGASDTPAACIISVNAETMSMQTENKINSNPNQHEEAGIGLSNIERQLQLMYRDFNFRYGAFGNVFKVNLNIKLSSYAGDELFDSRR